ncbi:5,10-methenyltetrahydrofolate synthetase [Desulfosporosinus orientis DSM 765]|uniref:5-formyltetrahydrofolate cyclo-ligase n=1 Tax=Desulfosporosinus orientis (strain ATCC 19365 / DSM 765 / NCIMB 8382 / VKM B-1628 / Singapore I) TaxID=768706 RepID=G7W5C3_DESOD|nr:5-formyltetrahydrofolate cyclo-ligase [Desulfosporosinus orientis]AET66351.1 5,10-methenyltetrahydrofolate synthetase [Desulfosporosinus orientis DSM 765]
MNEVNKKLKAEVRKSCLNQRAALGEQERKSKSLIIQQRLWDSLDFQKAQTVMLFLNFRDEVETTATAEAVLASKKRLILPRCAPKGVILPLEVSNLALDLELGAWGIREPKLTNVEVNPLEIDLVVVPGAGFDLQGNRLGYGGGYYDRFFERLKNSVPKVALSFESQIIGQVPVDEHDAKMTKLITEKMVYVFSRKG